ncbi:nitroreductase [Granulicella sp. 5B5]|uniref:nitroreductase family protein n=1 Tax=Granulicella sp. 5B5 TaxID=1617967 RepID=UPI0015F67F8B|nr:nitroreductase family protein [Granulicella sp. 5B5]QMV19897.1 nitroreductase [Granulicella sp. 5B5]
MEFREALQNRRSVRSYQDAALEPSIIQALIDAAILAPSAVNTQPWEFWVVLGRDRINSLSDRAKSWLLEKVAHDPTAGAVDQRQHLSDPGLSLLYYAPVLMLVVAKSFEKQANEDSCLAAFALMLAARDAGIGTCWIGSARPWFNLPATKKELGIPESDCVVAPIVMGYPKAWPEGYSRRPATIHWVGKPSDKGNH